MDVKTPSPPPHFKKRLDGNFGSITNDMETKLICENNLTDSKVNFSQQHKVDTKEFLKELTGEQRKASNQLTDTSIFFTKSLDISALVSHKSKSSKFPLTDRTNLTVQEHLTKADDSVDDENCSPVVRPAKYFIPPWKKATSANTDAENRTSKTCSFLTSKSVNDVSKKECNEVEKNNVAKKCMSVQKSRETLNKKTPSLSAKRPLLGSAQFNSNACSSPKNIFSSSSQNSLPDIKEMSHLALQECTVGDTAEHPLHNGYLKTTVGVQINSKQQNGFDDKMISQTPVHYSHNGISHNRLFTKSQTSDTQKSRCTQTDTIKVKSTASQTEKEANKSFQSPNTSDTMKMPQEMEKVLINGVNYFVFRSLGKGGSSKVEQVLELNNNGIFALKTVNLNEQPASAIEGFKKEILLLKKLQFSDKVIKLIDYEFKQSENKLYILMECGETDLAVFLKRRLAEGPMRKTLRCQYWEAMLQAVKILHEQGIVHSDIKPANFMLVAGEVKLIDFGIAKQLETDMTSMLLEGCVGTLNYMAPENLVSIGNSNMQNKVGRKVDVWSLGCILYYMAYGYTPFQNITNIAQKFAAITNESFQIEFKDIGEPQLVSTLQACLQRDPKKRAGIEDLLSHPYVKWST